MALRFKKSGSGIDLCRRIRNLDQNAPVVFVSAAAYNSDHRKAMAAGATAYLDKPVDPWVLEQTVTRLIKQVEARSLEARIMEINAIREAISDHDDPRSSENRLRSLTTTCSKPRLTTASRRPAGPELISIAFGRGVGRN